MSRIARTFSALRKKKEKALIVFITAGDPSLSVSERLIPCFEKEGVDIIELGIPFSDPVADGPVIQASSQRALARGTTLKKILGMAKRARKRTQVPLVLMGYLNPILRYGLRRFASQAAAAGIDGLIVPDLPPEEAKEIAAELRRAGMDLIFLLAPTSSPARRRLVAKASQGFVYYVSITGVTGVRKKLPKEIRRQLLEAKRQARIPVCVGFGISTPRQAKEVSRAADGVIVGSAIVKQITAHSGQAPATLARRLIRPFARALGKGRAHG